MMNLIVGFFLLFIGFACSDVCKHEEIELNNLDVKTFKLGNVSYTCKCLADGSASPNIICTNDCNGCTYNNDTCLQNDETVTDTFFGTGYQCTCNSLLNQFQCETTSVTETCDGCFYNKLCLPEGQKVNVETLHHYLPCVCTQRKLVCQDIYHNYQLGKQPYFEKKPLEYLESRKVPPVTEASFEDIELPTEISKEGNSERNIDYIEQISAHNTANINSIGKENMTNATENQPQDFSMLFIKVNSTAVQFEKTQGVIKNVSNNNTDSVITENASQNEKLNELVKQDITHLANNVTARSVTVKETGRQVTQFGLNKVPLEPVGKNETFNKLAKRDVTHLANNVTVGPFTAKQNKIQVIQSGLNNDTLKLVQENETLKKLVKRAVTNPPNNVTVEPVTAEETKGNSILEPVEGNETLTELVKRDVTHPQNYVTPRPVTANETRIRVNQLSLENDVLESAGENETLKKLLERDVNYPENNVTAKPVTATETITDVIQSGVNNATIESLGEKETSRKLVKRYVTHSRNDRTTVSVTGNETEGHVTQPSVNNSALEPVQGNETLNELVKRDVTQPENYVTAGPVTGKEANTQVTKSSVGNFSSEIARENKTLNNLAKRDVTRPENYVTAGPARAKQVRGQVAQSSVNNDTLEFLREQETLRQFVERYTIYSQNNVTSLDNDRVESAGRNETLKKLQERNVNYPENNVTAEPVKIKEIITEVIQSRTNNATVESIEEREALEKLIKRSVSNPENDVTDGTVISGQTKGQVTQSSVNNETLESVRENETLKQLVKRDVTHPQYYVTAEPVTTNDTKRQAATHSTLNNDTLGLLGENETLKQLVKRDVTDLVDDVTAGYVTGKLTSRHVTHFILDGPLTESHFREDNLTAGFIGPQKLKEENIRTINYTNGNSITSEAVSGGQRYKNLAKIHVTYSINNSVTPQDANKFSKNHFADTIVNKTLNELVPEQQLFNKHPKRDVTPNSRVTLNSRVGDAKVNVTKQSRIKEISERLIIYSHSDNVTQKSVTARDTSYNKRDAVIAEPGETKKTTTEIDGNYVSENDFIIPTFGITQERIKKVSKRSISRDGSQVNALTGQEVIVQPVVKHVTNSCEDCITAKPVTSGNTTEENATKQQENANLQTNLPQNTHVPRPSPRLFISEIAKDSNKPKSNIFEELMMNKVTDTESKVVGVTVIYRLAGLKNAFVFNRTKDLDGQQKPLKTQPNSNSNIQIKNQFKLKPITRSDDAVSQQNYFQNQLSLIFSLHRSAYSNQNSPNYNKTEKRSVTTAQLPLENRINQADSINLTRQNLNITDAAESQTNKNASDTNYLRKKMLSTDMTNKTDGFSELSNVFSLTNKSENSLLNQVIPTARSPKSLTVPPHTTKPLFKNKLFTKNGEH